MRVKRSLLPWRFDVVPALAVPVSPADFGRTLDNAWTDSAFDRGAHRTPPLLAVFVFCLERLALSNQWRSVLGPARRCHGVCGEQREGRGHGGPAARRRPRGDADPEDRARLSLSLSSRGRGRRRDA